MSKHQVIRDVGQTLLGVLRAELSAQKSKAKAHLAAPTADFLRRNAPCLVLHLYDLRPSVDVRANENWQVEEEVTDDKGETHVVRYARPLEMGLRYLITAAAEDVGDEHEILAIGMKAFLDHPKLHGDQLLGDSFFRQDALQLHPDTDFTLETAGSVFAGLGQGTRLAVGYRTEARLYSGREIGRSKRVRERHIDVFDQLRPPPGSISARELGVEAKPPKIVSPPRK
ncbi:MAG TPA: Pvc16 family protein [Myxococcales bacterium]|nr:Pvc16 family protein [Myxococcales bacterium]